MATVKQSKDFQALEINIKGRDFIAFVRNSYHVVTKAGHRLYIRSVEDPDLMNPAFSAGRHSRNEGGFIEFEGFGCQTDRDVIRYKSFPEAEAALYALCGQINDALGVKGA